MNFREIPGKILRRHFAVLWVGGMAFAMLVYVNWISWYRINNFLTFVPFDTGRVNSMLWNLMHGGWFSETPLMNGVNYFAEHAYFYIIPLLPFYALYPHSIAIIWMRNSSVIASVIPIYLITKVHLKGNTKPALVCAAWLATPFLASFCYCESGPLWALCPLVSAYYFYTIRNFRAFAISAVLTILSGENFVFLFLAWGCLAFLDRREWRWSLGLSFFAAFYFLAYHLMKHGFWPDSSRKLNSFENYYGFWGHSLGSCLVGMIAHPLEVLAFLTNPGKWSLLLYYAFPFLPFLFARPRLLFLSSPCIAIFFLMSSPDEYFYAPFAIPHFLDSCAFSFIGFIEFMGQHTGQKERKMEWKILFAIGFLTMIGVGILSEKYSPYLLVLTGLRHAEFLSLLLSGLGLSLLLLFYCQGSGKTWGVVRLTMVLLLMIFTFRGSVFRKSILCVESHIFRLTEHQKYRNAIARAVLEGVSREKWLSIPTKYSLVATNRMKVFIYNGEVSLSSLGNYSESRPEYVFLDAMNYDSILNAEALGSKWDKSHIWNLLNDHQQWELVFFYDGLYLLKRILPGGKGGNS